MPASAGIVSRRIASPATQRCCVRSWSFHKTAARSGADRTSHTTDGRPNAGAQAYWGALFIKLFLDSHFWPYGCPCAAGSGCAALLYVCNRRASLPPGLALFGALTITYPLFIPTPRRHDHPRPVLSGILYGYVALRCAGRADRAPAESPVGMAPVRSVSGCSGHRAKQLVCAHAPSGSLVDAGTFRRLASGARSTSRFSGLIALGVRMGFSAWFKDQPVHGSVKVGCDRFLTNEDAPGNLGRVAGLHHANAGSHDDSSADHSSDAVSPVARRQRFRVSPGLRNYFDLHLGSRVV